MCVCVCVCVCVCRFPNPSLRAYGKEGAEESLYRVTFAQIALWQAAGLAYEGGTQDTVDVEVYCNWLMPWSDLQPTLKCQSLCADA